ncbi:MAG: class I SAM-dependent methyltransferase [Thermoplasmata archaeon]|nr:class I SAM-dependent methyltransferase [Thermoplasmata archaeon]
MKDPRARRRASPRTPSTASAGHVRRNVRLWDGQSDEYERKHGRSLRGGRAAAWGFFRIPERKLRLLGATRGRRILELGCGAGRWSAALKAGGAQPIGLDISLRRLSQARRVQIRHRVRFPILCANAEQLPFRDEVFDVVFCDWGAMTFGDPHRTVPEVARVLRPRGVFVFSNSSPFRTVAHDRTRDRIGRTLLYPYFGLGPIEFPGEINFQLGYGEWVRLFRACGFHIDRLVEPSAYGRSRSSYLSAQEMAWARRWPIESIWRLIKEDSPRTSP